MKEFHERNPLPIAVFGTLALLVIFLVAFRAESMPVIGAGTSYTAVFREAGGLSADSEVRIAGVKAGEVSDIELDGDTVLVHFAVDDAWVGDRTTASIELKTLLGQKYLSLDPAGDDELEDGGVIPVERTVVPYDMSTALEDLQQTVEEIDVPQLAESFRSLSSAFDGTSEDIGTMLNGLSSLASTISSRDDELASLMRSTRDVTGDLVDVDDQLALLLQDGDLLLTELDARREAIHQLLVGTKELATEVAGLVEDNAGALAPALRKLDRVSRILQRNRDDLDEALRLLGPYYSLLTDATGSGPWLDGYLCGLFDTDDRPELDADAQRTCTPGGAR